MSSTLQETASTTAADVLARLEAAWNRGDGPGFAAPYADDALFVTIHGVLLVGSDAIATGHAGIFATIYAGSVNRMRLVRADRLTDSVVLLVSTSTLDCPTGPLMGRHDARSTSVLSRTDPEGSWRIVSTHNTLVAG